LFRTSAAFSLLLSGGEGNCVFALLFPPELLEEFRKETSNVAYQRPFFRVVPVLAGDLPALRTEEHPFAALNVLL